MVPHIAGRFFTSGTTICQLYSGNPGSISELGRSAEEQIDYPLLYSWASLVAQLVKNLPAMWGTIPFSSCPQSLPASESFPMSQLFA